VSLILDIHGPLMSCGQLRREALLYKNAFVHLDWLGELDLNLFQGRNLLLGGCTPSAAPAPICSWIRITSQAFTPNFPHSVVLEVENINIAHAERVLKYRLSRAIVGHSSQELAVRVSCELLAASGTHTKGDKAAPRQACAISSGARVDAGSRVASRITWTFACVCFAISKSGGQGPHHSPVPPSTPSPDF
jgi:hypothetical protein